MSLCHINLSNSRTIFILLFYKLFLSAIHGPSVAQCNTRLARPEPSPVNKAFVAEMLRCYSLQHMFAL